MEKIKVIYGTNTNGTITMLNKLDTMKLLLDLLENKEIKSIEIEIKEQTP